MCDYEDEIKARQIRSLPEVVERQQIEDMFDRAHWYKDEKESEELYEDAYNLLSEWKRKNIQLSLAEEASELLAEADDLEKSANDESLPLSDSKERAQKLRQRAQKLLNSWRRPGFCIGTD